MTELSLSAEERALLAGAEGPGVQKAMAVIVALGRIYGAPDLVPISHAHISGVSYKNIGDAGIAFLREWADRVPESGCQQRSTRWAWSAACGRRGASTPNSPSRS